VGLKVTRRKLANPSETTARSRGRHTDPWHREVGRPATRSRGRSRTSASRCRDPRKARGTVTFQGACRTYSNKEASLARCGESSTTRTADGVGHGRRRRSGEAPAPPPPSRRDAGAATATRAASAADRTADVQRIAIVALIVGSARAIVGVSASVRTAAPDVA